MEFILFNPQNSYTSRFINLCLILIMPSLSLCFITIIFLLGKVQGRLLRINSSNQLISDGIDDRLNNQEYGQHLLSSGKICQQLYGIFPCANSIGGYIFLIVVYQYLLITGERLVSRGSKALFNILRTGIFGATIFQILKTFPRIVMFIGNFQPFCLPLI